MISFVSQSSTASNASALAASQGSLANNFDTFLTLLTSQIQNQDPLKPMDSTQFTQQLVQFSGVEQQIRTNQSLETLISATRSTTASGLSGYLGETARIATPVAAYDGEQPIQFGYTLPREAASAQIQILDAYGAVVQTATAETGAGTHEFVWDGQTSSGRAQPGAYKIVVSASDSNDASITPLYSVTSMVTGIDLSYGEPAMTTSNGIYAYSDILQFVRN